MSKRQPWGHTSRQCVRCGNVGPRIGDVDCRGWVHYYCLTAEEKRNRKNKPNRKQKP